VPKATVWNNKKIVFVTGKGGVGKSLIAAGIARALAMQGKRVLLAEVGENSYYKDFWNLNEVGHDPRSVPGEPFDLALWSGETCLREYVLYYLKIESLYRLFFENKVMRALINIAPGLSEIAILGKITSGIRKVGPPLEYDTIIVDTYATGHALALFRAPRGMMEAIHMGPMGNNSRDIKNVIEDADLTAFVLVSLLEELPVTETTEFHETLKSEFGITASIIANKVLSIPVATTTLHKLASETGSDLKEFAMYLEDHSGRQSQFRNELAKKDKALTEVPTIFTDRPKQLVDRVAEELSR
jgi:anion-transporting  ArsA/GET3 family ATPase